MWAGGRFVPIALRLVGIAVLALALFGCGASDGGGSTAERAADISVSRVDKCSDRLAARAKTDGLSDAEQDEIRRYVETTYCSRFVERGWVYDDGTLSIAAHKWMEAGREEECTRVTETGAETVPCEDIGEDPILDCALLHHVRRSEVRDYIQNLRRRNRHVECDDGTPLEQLGAP